MVFFKFEDSRHAQLPIYAVFHEESEFQVKNDEIRRPEAKKIGKTNPEKLEKTTNTKTYFRFFGHNSVPGPRIWTKLGGFFPQESPGPF